MRENGVGMGWNGQCQYYNYRVGRKEPIWRSLTEYTECDGGEARGKERVATQREDHRPCDE